MFRPLIFRREFATFNNFCKIQLLMKRDILPRKRKVVQHTELPRRRLSTFYNYTDITVTQ